MYYVLYIVYYVLYIVYYVLMSPSQNARGHNAK